MSVLFWSVATSLARPDGAARPISAGRVAERSWTSNWSGWLWVRSREAEILFRHRLGKGCPDAHAAIRSWSPPPATHTDNAFNRSFKIRSHQLLGQCETQCHSSQNDCHLSVFTLAITSSENVCACPNDHDNNTKPAIYVMCRLRQVHLDPIFWVKAQVRLIARTTANEALESPFPKLYTFSKLVDLLSRNRNPNRAKMNTFM